jgi:hypothetical protein
MEKTNPFEQVAYETSNRLLKSMFQPHDRGETQSFLYGDVGAAPWDYRCGVSIHYDEEVLLDTILYLRKNGPIYLRQLPVTEIRSLLLDFVSDYYAILEGGTFLGIFRHSYAYHIPPSRQNTFALALLKSPILSPDLNLSLFPLSNIEVTNSYFSNQFFLVNNEDLAKVEYPSWVSKEDIDAEKMPPFKDSKIKGDQISWLGIWTPTSQSANQSKAAILGAMALTLHNKNRYVISIREPATGSCTINTNSFSYSCATSITPSLMYKVCITSKDHSWLKVLSDKVFSNEKKIVREMRSLEYFYKTWFLDESERYPALYMSLESVFYGAGTAKALIDAIINLIGDHISEKRIRGLTDLRAAVLHGGSPQVYDSSKYAKYYNTYKEDPITDLALLSAECLRLMIFEKHLTEKCDQNAVYIEAAIKSGKFPKIKDNSILKP